MKNKIENVFTIGKEKNNLKGEIADRQDNEDYYEVKEANDDDYKLLEEFNSCVSKQPNREQLKYDKDIFSKEKNN